MKTPKYLKYADENGNVNVLHMNENFTKLYAAIYSLGYETRRKRYPQAKDVLSERATALAMIGIYILGFCAGFVISY